MASVHSIDCICERCVRLRQSETSKVTNDRIPAIVSHMREWLEVTESKPLMLFVLDREAVRQFVARFSDEPPADHPVARTLREMADAQDAQDPNDMIAFTPTALRRFADRIDRQPEPTAPPDVEKEMAEFAAWARIYDGSIADAFERDVVPLVRSALNRTGDA